MEIYVSMSLFLFFLFPLLFRSMAGLTRCRCSEVLVLHRIIKMPNSLERDPNLSLEKKNTIFCILPEMQGAQTDETFTQC